VGYRSWASTTIVARQRDDAPACLFPGSPHVFTLLVLIKVMV